MTEENDGWYEQVGREQEWWEYHEWLEEQEKAKVAQIEEHMQRAFEEIFGGKHD